jgi:hypothetical protein
MNNLVLCMLGNWCWYWFRCATYFPRQKYESLFIIKNKLWQTHVAFYWVINQINRKSEMFIFFNNKHTNCIIFLVQISMIKHSSKLFLSIFKFSFLIGDLCSHKRSFYYIDWLIDWLLLNIKWAVYQLYSWRPEQAHKQYTV